MRMRLVLVGLATVALLDPTPILAQDAADMGHGREIAQIICAACHVVAKGQLVSPNSEAPPVSCACRHSRHDYDCTDRRVTDHTSADA